MTNLQSDFHREMMELYERAATECGYRATRYIAMLHELGGLAAANKLLRANRPAEGLTILWEKGRLDLSVEALVCKKPWRNLFAREEIEAAQRRLKSVGYQARAGTYRHR